MLIPKKLVRALGRSVARAQVAKSAKQCEANAWQIDIERTRRAAGSDRSVPGSKALKWNMMKPQAFYGYM